ncbi:unnamed protein product [Rhizoctonia solani]|uniref:DUF6593 domain-containing protein n=1 Tax=Rhizoctonia solani TaxID=456999 RepID=A0A8H3GJK8_9AGAM|nr:unnamed protein product [Rhizoctonia solani]
MFGSELTMGGKTASVSDVFPSAGKLSSSRIFTTADGEGLKWKDRSKLYCVSTNDGSSVATYNHRKLSSAFSGKKATLDISPNATHLADILVVTWVIAAKKAQDRSAAATSGSSGASASVAASGGYCSTYVYHDIISLKNMGRNLKTGQKSETGAKNVDELRERVRRELEAEKARQKVQNATLESEQHVDNASQGNSIPAPAIKTRKDSSPIKPLDTILNLPKLLSSSPPLTSTQLGALWTGYHARKEGVLCAVVPLGMYEQLVENARRYSQFVVPLPRGTKPTEEGKEAEGGTEIFFTEWALHHSPAVPNSNFDELGLPTSPTTEQPTPKGSNPPIITLLFTPLQEYKHRQSFAAPHLALTFYTDLAVTHGVALLRGEITPAQSGDGRWLLGQEEAQALVVAMQKFYLPGTGEGAKEREELLKCFHERPEDFKWERLLELSDIGIKL